ncbi:hypothetical protein SAMN05660668_02806, partial [Pseudobutyrivibrio sp. AR14]|uniref:hypothetical protein n=1 Tax=Pseudobutyrivibrio sp. AR14 TaxID=1520804 RepID=UPI0008922AAE
PAPVGALGAGVTGFTMEYVDEVYINPALRANILNDEAAYNIDYKQALINAGIAGAFTAGTYYIESVAASRSTAEVVANENAELAAVDSPEVVIEESADLGNKLDYMLGKATGNKHNIQRSQAMQMELERIGIYDDIAGRDYLTQHLNKVVNDSSNISGVESRSYVAKEICGQPIMEYTATTRESFLMGQYGGVKLKTIWDGNRLLTVIIEGGY